MVKGIIGGANVSLKILSLPGILKTDLKPKDSKAKNKEISSSKATNKAITTYFKKRYKN